MAGEYVDALVVAEKRLIHLFPISQFLMEDFKSPYRPGISGNSG